MLVKKRRVRTGCGSCRSRKVKCDEGTPKCDACLHMNLECDYILQPRKSRTKRAVRGLTYDASSVTTIAVMEGDNTTEYEVNPIFESSYSDQGALASLWQSTRSPSPVPSSNSRLSISDSLQHVVSPLSNLPQASSAELGDSMRLFHHFTTWIVPQLERSSPFFDMASETWRNEVAMMTFSTPSVLHAVLALSAKDLELKTVQHSVEQVQKRYSSEWHEGRALMHLARDLELGGDEQEATPWAILLLSWLCIISNRQQTAVRHLNGAQQLITAKPFATSQNHTGKELSHVFLALDMTRASMRNLSTRPLAPASEHITKRLIMNASVSGTLDELLLYQMLDIIASLPGSPDCTYLEYATDRYILPQSTIDKIEYLLDNLQAWRMKARQLPAYKMMVDAKDQDAAQMTIFFPDPLAAILMVYYHWSLVRLIVEPLYWQQKAVLLQDHPINFIRGVVRGALSQHPSTYSSRILNSSGALNVLRPLYNCTVELDEDLEADLLALNKSSSDSTVLNLNTLYFQQNHRAVTMCWKKHFGSERFIADMFMRRPGEKEDFRIMDLYYFEEDTTASSTIPVNYYGVKTVDTSSNRVFVLTRSSDTAGIQSFSLDEALTDHWKEKCLQFDRVSPVPRRTRTYPAIEAKIEAMMRAELEACDLC